MHAISTRELAVSLRRSGYSYPYIAKQTGLSKSTLSDWLSKVPYVPNAEVIKAYGKARAAAGKRRAEIRQESLKEIRKTAEDDIGLFDERDLFMFGLGLYLGEGAKRHNAVRVVNADPRVIQCAVRWFRSIGIELHQFTPRIHLYPDNDIQESLQFWSKVTTIPEVQFHRAQVDRRTDKKLKKQGKLPFGTLHLSFRSQGRKEHGVLLFRKIQAWNDVMLEQIAKAELV